MGFRDCDVDKPLQAFQDQLSVFPANRGVPRLIATESTSTHVVLAFSIPCESWGSATSVQFLRRGDTVTFSIPCESWGSATLSATEMAEGLVKNFQYSLRIVGFRDFFLKMGLKGGASSTFSIPCESWGSATSDRSLYDNPQL